MRRNAVGPVPPAGDWATQTVGQGGGGASRRKQPATGARLSNWTGDSGSGSRWLPRVHPVRGRRDLFTAQSMALSLTVSGNREPACSLPSAWGRKWLSLEWLQLGQRVLGARGTLGWGLPGGSCSLTAHVQRPGCCHDSTQTLGAWNPVSPLP